MKDVQTAQLLSSDIWRDIMERKNSRPSMTKHGNKSNICAMLWQKQVKCISLRHSAKKTINNYGSITSVLSNNQLNQKKISDGKKNCPMSACADYSR